MIAGSLRSNMIHNITIRLAGLDDIDTIMGIVKDVVPIMRGQGNFQWDDIYPNPKIFTEDVSLEQLWVADVGGTVAGFSAITIDQSEEYANVGWDITEIAVVTHRLAVSPAWRGQGIAEALLKQAEVVAQNRGINVLRIDTNSHNKATRKLFPKLGYQYAGEIELNFRPNLKFCCYEKRIG